MMKPNDRLFRPAESPGPGLTTGFPGLDRLMDIGSGIVTLRSRDQAWLSSLAANILVRNHEPGRRILYLHWVDYHRRYWTIDYDRLARLCASLGRDVSSLSTDIQFVRCFSRDNAESRDNWERILSLAPGTHFAVLDSVSELWEDSARGKPVQRSLTYAVGQFSSLCSMAGCPGIALDRSGRPVHPFLGELSSVIIEFAVGEQVEARLAKHTCMAGRRVVIGTPKQNTLRGWWEVHDEPPV